MSSNVFVDWFRWLEMHVIYRPNAWKHWKDTAIMSSAAISTHSLIWLCLVRYVFSTNIWRSTISLTACHLFDQLLVWWKRAHLGRQDGEMSENFTSSLRPGFSRSLQQRRVVDCIFQLRWSMVLSIGFVDIVSNIHPISFIVCWQSYLGYGFGPVFENVNRWRQPTRIVCQVFAQRQVHPGGHFGQHSKVVGLF